MFGLCLPTGETYLLLNDDSKESIMMSDELHPKKHIMESKDVLYWVKKIGYQNIKSIVYKGNGKETKVSMADYYAEYGQTLNSKKD